MSANLCIDDKYFISPKYDFRTGIDSRVLNSKVPTKTLCMEKMNFGRSALCALLSCTHCLVYTLSTIQANISPSHALHKAKKTLF